MSHNGFPTLSKDVVVFVPGLGESFFAHKLEILRDNVQVIVRSCEQWACTITVVVRLYSLEQEEVLRTWSRLVLQKLFPRIAVVIYAQRALLGAFLASHQHLWKAFPRATHWIWILDDVRISSLVDVHRMLTCLEQHDLDIVSPTMSPLCSFCHRFMKSSREVPEGDEGGLVKWPPVRLRVTNFAELFCFVMTSSACRRLWALVPEDSQYLWGLDMLLHPYGALRLGLVDGAEMHHYYTSREGDKDTYKAMCRELRSVKKRYPQNVNFHFEEFRSVPLSG